MSKKGRIKKTKDELGQRSDLFDLSGDVKKRSRSIIDKLPPLFFQRGKISSVLGGIIYVASVLEEKHITQRKIAEMLETTVPTLRRQKERVLTELDFEDEFQKKLQGEGKRRTLYCYCPERRKDDEFSCNICDEVLKTLDGIVNHSADKHISNAGWKKRHSMHSTEYKVGTSEIKIRQLGTPPVWRVYLGNKPIKRCQSPKPYRYEYEYLEGESKEEIKKLVGELVGRGARIDMSSTEAIVSLEKEKNKGEGLVILNE